MENTLTRLKANPPTFKWSQLGDITKGRETLGEDMPILMYRLFQYTVKDILKREFSEAHASDVFREAGNLAGREFGINLMDLSVDFDTFIKNLKETLSNLKIGILNVEKADFEKFSFTITVSEDLDCSGLPDTDETVCDFDEGFISGILETYTGQPFNVVEVDCWASGDKTCRFLANLKD